MTEPRVQLRWPVAIAVAAAFMAIGATASYLLVRPQAPSSTEPTALAAPPSSEAAASLNPTRARSTDGAPLADVDMTLSDEAIKRAGIIVAAVESGPMVTTLRLPAVVEPNAYKQVNVTSLVSGRITSVRAELGAQVRQGQTLATVFSPELVDAQTRFIAASAELDAHERELARTTKLVELGSASRQELERIHAEHTAQRTNVDSARSRLELLGLSRKAVDALTAGQPVNANIDVPAPISGVVTERVANVGLNVDTAARLFTVVDLSTVWIVGNLYEQDFSRVRVGDRARIVSSAYPDLKVEGTISYIDPQVSPETRTAKVRVEVSNPRQELRLGMLAEVHIDSANRTPVTLVPKDAVQNVADRSFVYVSQPDAPNQFIEREVRLGPASEQRAQVTSGLTPGDRIVVEGSFFLRAERERLGLRKAASNATAVTPAASSARSAPSTLQTAKVLVTEKGFEPEKVSVPAGTAVRMTFLRTTDKTCATEVVFPSLNLRRVLPLNQPVEIELTPMKSGDIAFVCGMNMFKGVVVIE